MNWYALSGSIEQGLAYGILALGVYLTFRVLSFADLTVEGSFPLGAAVAATLIVNGAHPLTATSVAVLAGMAAGSMTALLHTKMRITGLLAFWHDVALLDQPAYHGPAQCAAAP